MKKLALVCALTGILGVGGYAAIGDVVAFLNSSGAGIRVASTGDLLPANDNESKCGSSSAAWSDLSSYDATVQDRLTVKNLTATSYGSNATTTWTVSNATTLRVTGTVAGNINWTIPSAATAGADAVIHIVDQSGALDSTHTVIVNSTSGNINGASTKNFATAYGHLWIESNGTNWFAH